MQELMVGVHIRSADDGGGDVVHFHYVPQAEEVQPTERALASLLLQQQCLGGREFRVPPQATGPIDEISIEWAGRADDFDVLLSMLSAVHQQLSPMWHAEDPIASAVRMPVLPGDPAGALLWMTTLCPPPQLLVEEVVHAMERIARWHEPVVAGPTLDLRIELIDYSFLRSLEVSAEHRCHIGGVSFLGVLTWRDDGLESEWFAVRRASRMVLPNAVLANVEPQEVEPNLIVMTVKCVHDPGLLGLQFQPHPSQPLRGNVPRALNDVAILM